MSKILSSTPIKSNQMPNFSDFLRVIHSGYTIYHLIFSQDSISGRCELSLTVL